MSTGAKAPETRLLAQTSAAAIRERGIHGLDEEAPQSGASSPSFLTSAQWTADGTSIIGTSSDQTVSTFVLPQDLLDASSEPRDLPSAATIRLPEPTQTLLGAPYFSLNEPASQIYLAGCRDHPIQLYHAFPSSATSTPLASYKLIRKETEAYITPSSMLWEQPGTHFVCGSANRIDYFDMSRHGSDGPILTIPTIPSRRHISKGGGVGMKGTVSAMAASPVDANGGYIIGAGTWTRWIGLYDLHRLDKVVANWSISQALTDADDGSGQGVAQLAWSPCGRYLIINERHSSNILVYDIRVTGQLLSVLRGRRAETQQRLNCDVFAGDAYGSGGFEVWAGSLDGVVNVWDEVGLHSDLATAPSWNWEAHEAPIGSTTLHSSGSVVATCSGGWEHSSDYDDGSSQSHTQSGPASNSILEESSLRIWSIGATESKDDMQQDQIPDRAR